MATFCFHFIRTQSYASPSSSPPLPPQSDEEDVRHPFPRAAPRRPDRPDRSGSSPHPPDRILSVDGGVAKFKRCGRRPHNMTQEEFEAVYGPEPTTIRMCTHCGGTESPQWRRG